jgi:hypothetical protein
MGWRRILARKTKGTVLAVSTETKGTVLGKTKGETKGTVLAVSGF